MINALTIDVEDYWSVFYGDWLQKEIEPTEAVVKNTEWFLGKFSDHNVKATFFVLGEVAKKFPSLVKQIAQQNHEIASHGFSHRQIFKLDRKGFRREVAESKKLLENIIGKEVLGHRAPAFSIMPETQWALEVLAEEGYKYDSSVYPISGKRYGWPDFSRSICRIDLPEGKSIVEVPMSTVNLFGKTLPAAGGGYIRHFPYAFTKWSMKSIQKKRPVIVYMHPYEIDTEDRKIEFIDLTERQRQNVIKFHKQQMRNRNTIKAKLLKLLEDFKFTTIVSLLNENVIENDKLFVR